MVITVAFVEIIVFVFDKHTMTISKSCSTRTSTDNLVPQSLEVHQNASSSSRYSEEIMKMPFPFVESLPSNTESNGRLCTLHSILESALGILNDEFDESPILSEVDPGQTPSPHQ